MPNMASNYKVILFASVLLTMQKSLVTSQQTFQCRDHEVTISGKLEEAMKSCGQSLGINSLSDLRPDKVSCFAKCIMETGGLVDASGNAHKENIMRDFDTTASESAKQAYKTEIEGCIDRHGTNLDPTQLTCLSYASLAICSVKAIKTICHLSI